jgi:hypothetical protein
LWSGVVTDEMPREVKVNKKLSTADHSDNKTTFNEIKRRCCELIMSEEWDRILHPLFASANGWIFISTSE